MAALGSSAWEGGGRDGSSAAGCAISIDGYGPGQHSERWRRNEGGIVTPCPPQGQRNGLLASSTLWHGRARGQRGPHQHICGGVLTEENLRHLKSKDAAGV